MIIVKPGADKKSVEELRHYLGGLGVEIQDIQGKDTTIMGLAGDTTGIDRGNIEAYECVERIVPIQEPFKKANRKFHPENSVFEISGRKIGGEKLAIIAGPCSVESEEQILSVAVDVKNYGASFLRGGAFKPRSSPYSFQGLGEKGIELLKMAKEKTGLPIVTEIMSLDKLELFLQDVDIIQVGARNMQNFDMLKELGKIKKPILLKRGASSTIEEFLMAAEYIMAGGNERVILCERGIRTFETYARNTLDLSIIPIIKRLSHLPIIIDPSHATGQWWMVESMCKAAVAAGADGLIIEVHNDPPKALCDGQQSVTPEQFRSIMDKLSIIAGVEGRTI